MIEDRLIEHPCPDCLARAIAADIRSAIDSTHQQGNRASLALAGGGTPMPIYRRLGEFDLDWSRVSAIPGDERWVDADHPASNYQALKSCFAQTTMELLPLVPAQAGPEPNLEQARASLDQLMKPFSAVLLGMGGDGHFASLFPNAVSPAVGLAPESNEDVLLVTPDPLPTEAPYPRVSLSLARLLRTDKLILAITGQAKLDVLELAAQSAAHLAARQEVDISRLPIAALLAHAGSRLEIHWSP